MPDVQHASSPLLQAASLYHPNGDKKYLNKTVDLTQLTSAKQRHLYIFFIFRTFIATVSKSKAINHWKNLAGIISIEFRQRVPSRDS